jgi:molybdopterin-guanine dinucleotide biosynthesis protein A
MIFFKLGANRSFRTLVRFKFSRFGLLITSNNECFMSENKKYPCTGVILAGGLNTRFFGKDKALLKVAGKSILERILDVFNALFDEIILITNKPLRYCDWDLTIVTDLLPFRSSLTGIHTGLFYSSHPYIFCSGCDTPFLKKELVESMVAQIWSDADLIIPDTSAGMEPLCAVYAKRNLYNVEKHVMDGKCKIIRVFSKKRIRNIPEDFLRRTDPHLTSFFNVNTPEDLVEAEQRAKLNLEVP